MPTARLLRTGPALWFLFLAAVQLALPRAAGSSPYEYLPVGDPLEDELRILDALGPEAPGHPLRLPRLGMRPLQRFELDSLPLPEGVADPARRIALTRIARVQARDRRAAASGVAGVTPRLFEHRPPGGAAFEVSAGVEGELDVGDHPPRFRSGSGLQGRVALESDRWLAFTHLTLGRVDSARSFANVLFPGHDVILQSEETYLAYTGSDGRWGVQFGRSRWHWGPGEEGSLLLSRTSAPLTGLAFHARLEALHADGIALSATLRPAAGEQFAAHRLEWQPFDALRLGLSESARYRSEAWQPLYLVGVIPYIIVQRLFDQDEPDSVAAHRNNVMIGTDVTWRVAAGTRLYAEWLADDVRTPPGLPRKYGYQLGWDGAGAVHATRVTWGGEYTRITQFVYTSYFGRDDVAQGRPLGFPVAPDVRRLRVRVGWDPSADWQLTATAFRSEKGENELSMPFTPQSPPVDAAQLSGVVEETRDVEGALRWWPAGGIDLSASLGYQWVDDAGHVVGARIRSARGTVALRLVR